MLTEFRKFILRGNVVDLAVGVVIGAAFGAVVNAMVSDFVTPIIAALGGQPDFGNLKFEINDSVFRYGHFINAVISFVIIATAVFFFVVRPLNVLMDRFGLGDQPNKPTHECPECLSSIPVDAKRCSHCTTEVPPGAPEVATR